MLTTPHLKTGLVTTQIHVPGAWSDPLVRTKQWKMDVRVGTWNVRSLYRAGSLTAAAARELARYNLDLVGVQEVGWENGGTVRAGDYSFFLNNTL